MKDVRLFYDTILPNSTLKCVSDYKCETCMKFGVETDLCQKCSFNWDKLVANKCVCSAITDCEDCSSDRVCEKCKDNKFINVAVIPHTCVDKCPVNTH